MIFLFFADLSDLPKLCFAATFVKGQNKSMDYFTCNKCGFNCELV